MVASPSCRIGTWFVGAGYLVDLLAAFLVPGLAPKISAFVLIPPIIAEFWMLGYLLVIGVRSPKRDERILAAA